LAGAELATWEGLTLVAVITEVSLPAASQYPGILTLMPYGDIYGGFNLSTNREGTVRFVSLRAGNSTNFLTATRSNVTPPASEIADGDRLVIVGRWDKSTLWLGVNRNGNRVANSVAHAYDWRNATQELAVGGYYRTTGSTFRSSQSKVAMAAVIPRDVGLRTANQFLQDPWGTFFEPQRIWVPVSAGLPPGTALVGADATQANVAATGAVAQSHAVVAAAGTQVNAGATGAVSQSHVLAGAAGVSANVGASAAVAQTHQVIGAGGSQANVGATGTIVQNVSLVGAPGSQANVGEAAGVLQTHTLGAGAGSQENVAAGAGIAQTALVAGAAGDQANEAGTGAIVQTLALLGEDGDQANTGSVGGIGSEAFLVGAPGQQANVGTVGAIVQSHELSDADAEQDNVTDVGAIVQTHALGGSDGSQANVGETAGLGEQTIVLDGAPGSQGNEAGEGAIVQTLILLSIDSDQLNEAQAAALTQTHALFAEVGLQFNTGGTGAIITEEPVDPNLLNGINDYLAAGTPILTRLKSLVSLVPDTNFFRPATLKDMEEISQPNRAIHVMYAGDAPDNDNAGRGQAQTVAQRWMVVVAVRHPLAQLQNSQEILNLAGPIISQVLDALQGWAPVEWMRPLSRVPGPTTGYSTAFAYYPLLFQGRITTVGKGI
jgi:hypothetical protein